MTEDSKHVLTWKHCRNTTNIICSRFEAVTAEVAAEQKGKQHTYVQ